MKTENDSGQPQTPATPFPATQWSSSQIPIDPALQQQSQQAHYQGYSSHYPQATYPTHYQPYVPPAAAQQPQSQPQAQPSRQAQGNAQSNSGMDTADIATLNDALGSAGVDLRAEEETLQRSHEQHQTYRSFEDRTRKQPTKPSFDTRYLGPTMRTIGTKHKISKIPDDSVNYLALALRTRLQELIVAMIAASYHRTDTQFDRPASLYEDGTPMWGIHIRNDVAKQLAVLEKVEREEEVKIRRERKERADMAAAHAAALSSQIPGGGNGMALDGFDEFDGGGKKKKKKDGPGVTARNMSEDVRKKMSNAVASQAAGLGGKYAWMNAANANAASSTSKSKAGAKTEPAGASTATSPATTTTPATGTGAAGWARPYVSTKKSSGPSQSAEEDKRTTVSLRDALFVIEKERGHGGGRGAARGWV